MESSGAVVRGIGRGAYEFGEGVVSGLWTLGKGLLHATAHPVETSKTVASAVKTVLTDPVGSAKHVAMVASAVGTELKNVVQESARKVMDPNVSLEEKTRILTRGTLEIASVVAGGAGLAKNAASAAKVAEVANAAKVAEAANVVKVGEASSHVAKAAEAASAVTKAGDAAAEVSSLTKAANPVRYVEKMAADGTRTFRTEGVLVAGNQETPVSIVGKIAGDKTSSTQLYHGYVGNKAPHTTFHSDGSIWRTTDGKANKVGQLASAENEAAIAAGNSQRTSLYNREYTTHGSVRAEDPTRQLYPSVVENAIQNGEVYLDKKWPETFRFNDPVNGVSVVTNRQGAVVTVVPNSINTNNVERFVPVDRTSELASQVDSVRAMGAQAWDKAWTAPKLSAETASALRGTASDTVSAMVATTGDRYPAFSSAAKDLLGQIQSAAPDWSVPAKTIQQVANGAASSLPNAAIFCQTAATGCLGPEHIATAGTKALVDVAEACKLPDQMQAVIGGLASQHSLLGSVMTNAHPLAVTSQVVNLLSSGMKLESTLTEKDNDSALLVTSLTNERLPSLDAVQQRLASHGLQESPKLEFADAKALFSQMGRSANNRVQAVKEQIKEASGSCSSWEELATKVGRVEESVLQKLETDCGPVLGPSFHEALQPNASILPPLFSAVDPFKTENTAIFDASKLMEAMPNK